MAAVLRLRSMETLNSRSDAELLGDQERPADAFAVLYRRHVSSVLRFVAARGADADTAADIVAETFMIALAKRGRYRPQHSSARLWLLGIAARELADVHRHSVRDRERQRRLAQEPIELTTADRESYNPHVGCPIDLRELLGSLPDAQRLAVAGRVMQDQEYADIARQLGLSEPATRKVVSRGLAAMRAQLERSK
jgi:RNA polymerase sigma factor (sigma-70 family)